MATSLQTGGPCRGYASTNRRVIPCYVPANRRDVPWLSRSVSDLSPLMSGFDPRLVYMGFMVNKLALSVFSNYLHFLGTRWPILLRHCATNWKVTGSIPDGVIGIFH